MRHNAIIGKSIQTLAGEAREDHLAVEAPLEIRLGYGPLEQRQQMVLAITMRTPGHDDDLAVGFLVGEGLIDSVQQISSIGPCGEPGESLRVELAPSVTFDPASVARNFYTSSSCGVCGKTALEAVRVSGGRNLSQCRFQVSVAALRSLPGQLGRSQPAFESTGGLHAAGLFCEAGKLEEVREDVGRHNAVDKLVGAAARAGQLPLSRHGLLLSGRASFELLQKAVMAGTPLVAAIGAPSSLAVEAAEAFGITLVAFLREGGGNLYASPERVICE